MLLTEKRPLKTPFVFGGRSFIIDMSFNNILSVFEAMEDDELDPIDRAKMAMYLLTGEEEFAEDDFMTDDDEIQFAQDFLATIFDELITEKKEEIVETDILGNPLPVIKNEDDSEKSFDFVFDAGYIFASFMQAYHMDLHEQHDKLHWELFLALFNGLPSETIMMKVIDIRQRPIPTGRNSREEAKELRDAKRRFALPDTVLEDDEE